jgi:hypothetical protein
VASAFPRGGQRAALITSPRLKSRYLQTLLASIREPGAWVAGVRG